MKKSNLEAFVESVRFEKEGRDYFLESAKKAKNEATTKIFEQIAEEELQHIKVINTVYDRMKETGSWDESTSDYKGYKGNKNRFVEIARAVPTKIKVSSDDVQALEHAMEIEKKGKALYQAKAAETDIEFEKKFFTFLAEEEEGHYLSFLDSCEYLADPEAWLEQKEKITLDGA